MAKSVSQLVSGAGIYLNFVTVLDEELRKIGGFPAMLYFAQREHARPLMALLAKTIVDSKLWKVPKSLIIQEIEGHQRDAQWLEEDKKHHWTTFSPLAEKLTTLYFANDISDFSAEVTIGIPDVGPYQKCGDVVELEGQKYVVTYCGSGGDGLFLAPAEWIDLDN